MSEPHNTHTHKTQREEEAHPGNRAPLRAEPVADGAQQGQDGVEHHGTVWIWMVLSVDAVKGKETGFSNPHTILHASKSHTHKSKNKSKTHP